VPRFFMVHGVEWLFYPSLEDHTIVSSFLWKNHRNVSDRQTDLS